MVRTSRRLPAWALSTALSTAFLLPALPRAAVAAEVSAAQATQLEQQFKQWLSGFLLPGMVALPDRPVRLTPSGDHYDAAISVGRTNPVDITATLRPLDGDRWAYEKVRLPPLLTFTMDVPTEEKDKDGKPTTTTMTYTVKTAEQDGSGVFDPSYKTESSSHGTYRALTVQGEGAGQQQTTQIARIVSDAKLTPVGEGRVDMTSVGNMEGYVATTTLPDNTPLRMEFDQVGVSSKISAVSPDKAMQITRTLFSLLGSMMAKAGPGGTPNPGDFDPAKLKPILTAFQDFASAMQVDETITGARIKVADYGGSLAGMKISFGAAAPNGVLSTFIDMGFDGPKVANPPLGPFEVFVPSHFQIRPTMSGITTADLFDLANAAADKPDNPPSSDDFMAKVFSHGGVVFGVESMGVDVAGSSFTGHGTVRVPSPDAVAAKRRSARRTSTR